MTSLAASSGIYLGSPFHFDMVRPGAALYGLNPTPYEPVNPMLPVVTLEARVLQVHDVKAGETVGYGADYLVERPARVATLSIGYADGVPRLLSNRGHAFIAGRIVPFIGRVSMDLMTVDVTDIPPEKIQPGMFAELIGANLALDAVAREAETIGYEILTGLGRRFSRVFLTSDRYESALQ
jgi:alanine racemase